MLVASSNWRAPPYGQGAHASQTGEGDDTRPYCLRHQRFSETLGDIHRGRAGRTAAAWPRTAYLLTPKTHRNHPARDDRTGGTRRHRVLRVGAIPNIAPTIPTRAVARALRHPTTR